MTYRALDDLGVNYRVINIEEKPDAYDVVVSLGYQQVPVVVVPFDAESMAGEHWSGFRPDKLKLLIR